jgi:antitoxin MazE
MKVQVAKWGNSTAVRLPAAVVKQLGLRPGMALEVTVDDGTVRLSADSAAQSARRPQPLTLDWIVSEMRRLGPAEEPETLAWGGDVGAEIVDDDTAR